MSDDAQVPAPLKVVSFASKALSSTAWSPEQCIAEFLADIRAAKIAPTKIMILWFSEDQDGRLRPNRWFANVSSCEEVAMLELGKHIAIDDWKGRP